MREIKFRAWDKVNKKMLYHFLISNDGGIFIMKDPMLPTGDDFGVMDIIPIRDDVELLEYTGLKDLREREIYEGDIVKCWAKYDRMGEIVFFQGEFRTKECPEGRGSTYLPVYISSSEIIGNIYENSELLEKRSG